MHFCTRCKYLATLTLSELTSIAFPSRTTKWLRGTLAFVTKRASFAAACSAKQCGEPSIFNTVRSLGFEHVKMEVSLPMIISAFSTSGQLVRTTRPFANFLHTSGKTSWAHSLRRSREALFKNGALTHVSTSFISFRHGYYYGSYTFYLPFFLNVLSKSKTF